MKIFVTSSPRKAHFISLTLLAFYYKFKLIQIL
jgi:hypothetical protein